jgi:magnesium-transporting ATPase (P-type)
MRKLFINIIVVSQGFLLLTDGSVRNRFFETFAACKFILYLVGKNEHNDQELAQALMFGFAFVMMAGLFKNIFCQALSVFAFTFYTCFTYNLALFHDSASLYYFCLNLFVAALACDDFVTTYIDG